MQKHQEYQMLRQNVGLQQSLARFKDFVQQQRLTKSDLLKLLDAVKEAEYDIDYDFIKMFLFPEAYDPCRLPSKFGLPTAVFTHRFTSYISTGHSGSGFVCLLPHDTAFFCTYSNNLTTTDWTPTTNTAVDVAVLPESDSRFIGQNFEKSRLLAASMRVSYTGSVELESGFLQGAHVHTQVIGGISQQTMDDGFYIARGRPSQGIRLVWSPRDQADYELSENSYYVQDTITTSSTPIPQPIYGPIGGTSAPRLSVNRNFDASAQLDYFQSGTAGQYVFKYNPAQIWGMKGASNHDGISPHQLAVMWTGLPPNQTWFRVDVERHFEGIPDNIIRDLVAVKKCRGSEKTLDVVKQLSDDNALFGSTVQAANALYEKYSMSAADVIQQKLTSPYTNNFQVTMGGGSTSFNADNGYGYPQPEKMDYL